VAELSEDVAVELLPNRPIRLAVSATNVNGGERTESIDILYVPPQKPVRPVPVPEPARLFVLSIGCEAFASALPPIRFANNDASELASFLAVHLVSGDGTKTSPQPSRVLTGEKASVRSIQDAIDALHEMVEQKRVQKGDIVAIVIASHLLESKEGTLIAGSDTEISDPPRPAVPARDIAEVLGQLTDYGCRVVLFLDGMHKLDEPLASEIKPLVRDLHRKRRVITFVASKEGPSDVDTTQKLGLFALGLKRVFQGADLAGARGGRSAAYTLDQFKTELRNTVLNLSERRQEAFCYIPDEVPERTLFAKPLPEVRLSSPPRGSSGSGD
jgi:hypothetical protein